MRMWVRNTRSPLNHISRCLPRASTRSIVRPVSGVVSSIGDILDRLTAISGHTIEVEVNPAFVRKDDVEMLGGDVTLLRRTLPDWQPRDLGDTLQWMYDGEA